MPHTLAIRLALLATLATTSAAAAPAGTPDPAFSTDGATTIAFDLDADSNLDTVHAVVAGPGGMTYLVGLANAPENPQFPAYGGAAIAIARLTHAGKPDVHYGTLGRVTHTDPQLAHLVMHDAALTHDNHLLTAGYALAQTTRMTVCRFTPHGAIDSTFGDATTAGCARLDLGDDHAVAHTVLALPDGRIALGGENAIGDAIVVLLDAHGTRIPTFGDNGVRSLGTGWVADLARDAAGALVAVGTYDTLGLRAFVARLDASTGANLAGFGDGIVTLDHATPGVDDSFVAVTIAPDQRIVATGWRTATDITRAVVVRFDPDGQPDPTFGTAGTRHFAAAGAMHRLWLDDIAIDAIGRIHLAGRDVAWPGNTFTATAFAHRLHPDGSDDTGYGTAGTAPAPFAHIEPTDVHLALQGDRVLLATSVGDGPLPPLTADFGVARFDHGLKQRHRVTPKAGPGGVLKPHAAQTVAHGNVVAFLVAPKPGFALSQVGGCAGASSGTHYVAGPVLDDCVVTATFEPDP